ncbi:MAG: YunC family protein [Victivallaceae bacterium]|nr:YunC family protein [Victivallaceae bacterium]
MDKFSYMGFEFDAFTILSEHATILLLRAGNGLLGCGYFSTEAADKFGDALAVVTGVNSYDDMVLAKVKKVSAKAEKLGVRPGMTGGEALKKMC